MLGLGTNFEDGTQFLRRGQVVVGVGVEEIHVTAMQTIQRGRRGEIAKGEVKKRCVQDEVFG
eukprot:764022-Hanusia_phi.AAC.2